MKYEGKLYGHLGGKKYFDTGKTADDWDSLEKRVAELEAENKALRQPPVSGAVQEIDLFKNEEIGLYRNWDSTIDLMRFLKQENLCIIKKLQ